MDFINRKEETAQLEEYSRLSKKGLFTAAISGLRRVGKTTLIREFIRGKNALYFFVYESKTSASLLAEFEDELRKCGIITDIEKIGNWGMFFEILFKRCRGYILIFDEFQNFFSVDKSVFSVMQRYCDEYKETPLNIIILGSLVGLFKKIFEDRKKPLYGRITAKLKLEPFTLRHSLEAAKFLKYADFEEALKLYFLFGGFPKYYACMEQFELFNKELTEVIGYLFMQKNAPLENEVQDILKQEFGKRSALYYSILHAIASGKTKLAEIADATHMKSSSITRHVGELEERFELIKSAAPIGNKKNRRYFITHPLILFWFKFVYGKFSEYSIVDLGHIIASLKQDINAFYGKRFEAVCREFLLELNKSNCLPFRLAHINNWWGSANEEGQRKEIEIDFVADNNEDSIMFVECKWKDNVDAKSLLECLKEKTKFVKWRESSRKEHYCIIAKSFAKRVEESNVTLFDLKEMAEALGWK
ncbi:MAG: ATP-binding protein [Nanoarchaeota archaeon]|nr:ATP-binding protein [Nanoarchaeota archaeon]